MPKTKRQEIGRIGEDIAEIFLKKKGFELLARNFWKPWGEIDVVARKKNVIHFIEVKTSQTSSGYRGEENVHEKKLQRLERTIYSYLSQYDLEDDEWQLDVIAVALDVAEKKASVKWLQNVF